MDIEFDISNDKKKVTILGVEGDTRRKIGHIFTPGGTSHNIRNAIQICGFSEAFDLWGCGVLAHPKESGINFKDTEVLAAIQDRGIEFTQAKDIQLKFEPATKEVISDYGCVCCYNKSCTCENKGNHTHICPFNVKRADDVAGLDIIDKNIHEINRTMMDTDGNEIWRKE